jgi:hypothetical protein
LTLVSGAAASPIVWHPEARLSDDGRRVIDTRTRREVAVGAAVALVGGMRARAEVSAAEAQAWNLPAHCTGDSILLVGVGFHEQDNR